MTADRSASADHADAAVGESIVSRTESALLGCAAARVAVLERGRGLAAYKTLCTHFVLASAIATRAAVDGLSAAISTADVGESSGAVGFVQRRFGSRRDRDTRARDPGTRPLVDGFVR